MRHCFRPAPDRSQLVRSSKMRLGFQVVTTVLALSLITFAQTNQSEITSAADLATALCSVESNEKARDDLLNSYPTLTDRCVWEDISNRAAAASYDQSPTRTLQIYDVLIQVATKLSQPQLLARSYYNLARTFSGLNQRDNAIESYIKSNMYFERAALRRDQIYVLADLGRLYFNKEDY